MLIVGVLRPLFAEYLPNSELAFIPLIVLAAMVADWRGVLALALTCAVVDLIAELRLMTLPHVSLSTPAFLNQMVITITFVLTGLIVFFLTETIRHRTQESEHAATLASENEREQRETAERAAERWETLNGVGLKVQQESRPEQVYRAIERELDTLGLRYLIALWDEPERTCRIEYLSLPPSTQKEIESSVGSRISDVRHLSICGQARFRRQATLHSGCEEVIRAFMPQASTESVRQISQIAGAGALVIAPLLVGEHVSGFFCTWGPELGPLDVPALTGLGQQIAIALEKARLRCKNKSARDSSPWSAKLPNVPSECSMPTNCF